MKRTLAFVVVCLALVTASPAQGVVFVQGFTWYADGQYIKSGPSGTVVTAFGTSATANKPFLLMMVNPNPGYPCSDAHGPVAINPTVRFSNDRGFIPMTAGPVTGPPGEYEICFYEQTILYGDHRTGTSPAFFTIV